jgi:hypothetical protein
MWHVWGTGEGYTWFWWGDPKERNHVDLQEVGYGGMDWIASAQVTDR